jgi:hypothetical protein
VKIDEACGLDEGQVNIPGETYWKTAENEGSVRWKGWQVGCTGAWSRLLIARFKATEGLHSPFALFPAQRS